VNGYIDSGSSIQEIHATTFTEVGINDLLLAKIALALNLDKVDVVRGGAE